jgi:hypothetical protein
MTVTTGRTKQDMGNETTSALSPAETETFRHIVGLMVPADPGYGVPAATDPAIFADILASLGRDLESVRQAVSMLGGSVDEAAVCAFLSDPTQAAAALSRVVLQAYYRDDRVLLSLGHEARSPYPKGHVVEQGDWSLLDAVRDRPQLWRDDRRA